ncbi:MAG: hypothetical protein HXY50_15025 [Ignavibacteriaceae bacterium]|nr:hypothetical protein [Ignavibacteriaceae bacterium]
MQEVNSELPQIPDSSNNTDGISSESLNDLTQDALSVIEGEINSLNNGVGMRDISHLGVIELRGTDVLDFLHRISTNSIKQIVKGEVVKTIFTTEKGRVIDTASILNLDDYQLLICSQEHHEKMMIWLRKYVISDDVKLSNINGKYTLLEVLGPQADSFMTLISGNIVNNIPPNTVKIINTEGIIFFLMKHFDHNGQLIYWILADPLYAQKLIRYMIENRGPFDFSLVGESAYSLFRIEHGIPMAPYEINDSHNPHELGLMKLVSNNKGCYIGQEVIARLETYDKVQNHLCGFFISNGFIEEGNNLVFDENNLEAGQITSSIYSNRFKKQLGIGFVKRKYFEDGKILYARGKGDDLIKISVKRLPFKK